MQIRTTLTGAALRAIKAGIRWPNSPAIHKFRQWSEMVDLLRRLKINVFVDVGANRGSYARRLRAAGYAGTIVSFEPNPADFTELRSSANNDAAWLAFNYALGDTEQSANFHVNNEHSSLSSILDSSDGTGNGKTISVDVRRLDKVLPEIISSAAAPRIFLKLDTQGFDKRVFDGAAAMVDEIIGLQSEVSVRPLYQGAPHFTEAVAHYEKAGFELLDLFIVNRTNDGRVVEYDCMMAKPQYFPVIDDRYW